MPHIRSDETVASALAASDRGVPDAQNAHDHGVAVKTIRRWRRLYQRRGLPRGQAHTRTPCPRCDAADLDDEAYAERAGSTGQEEVVVAHPGALLRGLFHSDGCRTANWTRKLVAGEMKRYDYPRWQFSNNSDDIRDLCCRALDLVGVPWRQSSWKTISVSRREAVARLDDLIGLKS